MLFCDLIVQWVIGPWCFETTRQFHFQASKMSETLSKMRPPTCCAIWRTNYLAVQHHIPQAQRPRLYRCKRLDTRKRPIVSGLLNNVSSYNMSDSKKQAPFTCTRRWRHSHKKPPILENIKAKHSNNSTTDTQLQSITVANKFFYFI
jgi:hypothetical protein